MRMNDQRISYNSRGTVRDMTVCGLFTALIAAGAFIQITIPVQPVPMHFTLQWFFVLLAGFLLGGRRGAVSVLVYLMVGLLGVPVFASGGGPAYLLRPTFGFLLGFAAAAWVVGTLCGRERAAGFRRLFLAAAAGMAVYYTLGIMYFYVISNYVILIPVGWKLVLVNCFFLTAGGDLVLCALAASVAVKMRAALKAGLF